MDECYPESICGDCPLCEPWAAVGAKQGDKAIGTNTQPSFERACTNQGAAEDDHEHCASCPVCGPVCTQNPPEASP